MKRVFPPWASFCFAFVQNDQSPNLSKLATRVYFKVAFWTMKFLSPPVATLVSPYFVFCRMCQTYSISQFYGQIFLTMNGFSINFFINDGEGVAYIYSLKLCISSRKDFQFCNLGYFVFYEKLLKVTNGLVKQIFRIL